MVVGNWKMNTNVEEGIKLASKIRELLSNQTYGDIEVVLCPPFTSIGFISDVLRGSDLKLGAQNVYHAKEGSYTGEISLKMLKNINCKWVIVGHSERRQKFHETNQQISSR